ncbi:hypothetical protein F4804DRAFT_335054 [Jackrogersella minutella]|nr:hypothetical protein F4804DRAFT_335054 [Jackrogersella minutella]
MNNIPEEGATRKLELSLHGVVGIGNETVVSTLDEKVKVVVEPDSDDVVGKPGIEDDVNSGGIPCPLEVLDEVVPVTDALDDSGIDPSLIVDMVELGKGKGTVLELVIDRLIVDELISVTVDPVRIGVEFEKVYEAEPEPVSLDDILVGTDDVNKDAVVPDPVGSEVEFSLELDDRLVTVASEEVLFDRVYDTELSTDCVVGPEGPVLRELVAWNDDRVLSIVGCPDGLLAEGPVKVVLFGNGYGTELEIRVEEPVSLIVLVEVLPKAVSLPVMVWLEAVTTDVAVEFETGDEDKVCENPFDTLDILLVPIVTGTDPVLEITVPLGCTVGMGSTVTFVKGKGGTDDDTPDGCVGTPVPEVDPKTVEDTFPGPDVPVMDSVLVVVAGPVVKPVDWTESPVDPKLFVEFDKGNGGIGTGDIEADELIVPALVRVVKGVIVNGRDVFEVLVKVEDKPLDGFPDPFVVRPDGFTELSVEFSMGNGADELEIWPVVILETPELIELVMVIIPVVELPVITVEFVIGPTDLGATEDIVDKGTVIEFGMLVGPNVGEVMLLIGKGAVGEPVDEVLLNGKADDDRLPLGGTDVNVDIPVLKREPEVMAVCPVADEVELDIGGAVWLFELLVELDRGNGGEENGTDEREDGAVPGNPVLRVCELLLKKLLVRGTVGEVPGIDWLPGGEVPEVEPVGPDADAVEFGMGNGGLDEENKTLVSTLLFTPGADDVLKIVDPNIEVPVEKTMDDKLDGEVPEPERELLIVTDEFVKGNGADSVPAEVIGETLPDTELLKAVTVLVLRICVLEADILVDVENPWPLGLPPLVTSDDVELLMGNGGELKLDNVPEPVPKPDDCVWVSCDEDDRGTVMVPAVPGNVIVEIRVPVMVLVLLLDSGNGIVEDVPVWLSDPDGTTLLSSILDIDNVEIVNVGPLVGNGEITEPEL